MALGRKGFRAKQSRRMARRMDDSMVGSHVERRSQMPYPANEGVPNRGALRTSSRASHARVGVVEPASSSRESDAAYRRRTRRRGYVEDVQHKTRLRRVIVFLVAIAIVALVAAGAGFLAFRGSVGSEMSLKGSNASDVLVPVRSDESYYVLVSVELGAVAEPFEKEGPDIVLLAYVDREKGKLSLVNIPSSLQVAVDNAPMRLGNVASSDDAALIRAVQNFAKVDIAHFVKVGKGGLEGIVDALDGIEVVLDQVVDDPHAGDIYLPVGTYTLNGAAALTYLRADNLAMGVSDQLSNQLNLASLLLSRIFAQDGAFATRIESIDSYFQTDMSLADLEGLAGLFAGVAASDIACIPLPGYMTSTAGVVDVGDSRYVCSSDDMAGIIASLEGEEVPDEDRSEQVQTVNPSSFTVEVQNGTDIAGAASATAENLTAQGFRVEKTGNAEQQVYTETLVVYKTSDDSQGAASASVAAEDAEPTEEDIEYDEDGNPIQTDVDANANVKAAGGNGNGVGQSRANTVISALGMGRAVEAGSYYSFGTDVLVIIGSDYKPTS